MYDTNVNMYVCTVNIGPYKSSILRRRSRAGLERINRMHASAASAPAWLGPMKSPSAAATDVISRSSVNK